MGRRFFDELVRRRGCRLRLLVLATSPSPPLHPEDPAAEAERLEVRVRDAPSELRLWLPALIRLWHKADRPEKALRWETQALQSYNVLGMYEDARVYGERALAAQKVHAPEDHDLHGRIFAKLFMTYLALQMPEDARRLADVESAGREHSPEWRAQFLYSIAMLYARYLPERDFARAEALLDQGLEELARADIAEEDRHFQRVFNRNGLAMIRHFQGRFQEAIDLCRTGYEELDRHLGPDQHKLHRSVLLYNIAQVHGAARADEEAIRYYSAAVEMDPGYSEYYNERGSIRLRRGELEAALEDYRRAIALSPPYYEVFANLGQCCRLLGRMEEAVSAYSRSLDLKPDQVVSLLGRAEAHEALGRVSEALADYEAVVRLKPDHWPALASRAVLHHASGRLSQSLADLNRAIELAPQRPDLYRNRAVALADLHRAVEAAEDLRSYLRLCPDAEDRSEVERDCRQLEGMAARA
jgi:tetratricopeptide (TPR) repeat protein